MKEVWLVRVIFLLRFEIGFIENMRSVLILVLGFFRKLFFCLFLSVYCICVFLCAGYLNFFVRKKNKIPRVVWGSTPLINNSYWSRSLRAEGFLSETFTLDFYSGINQRADWDKVLSEEFLWAPNIIKPYIAFLESLFRYDIFVISFNGFFLGNTPICYLQSNIFKLARKKVIVLPYGSDSYIYNRIRSVNLLHGLLMSYPISARNQKKIAKDVDYWCEKADVVIPGMMGADGLGRWDVLLPSALSVDLDIWKPSVRKNCANGFNGVVTISHAPNHRGFKGSEFLIDAVGILKSEGLNIELKLLEHLKNSDVQRVLYEETDILVEQLIFTGHGLNGLEGMASGIPTISNLEDESYTMPVRRWSYFDECPLVSASPETLVEVLRKLVTRPELRNKLGTAGRAYAEKYHGLDSSHYLFSNVIDYVYGKKDSLINLYHPLLGEYPNRMPKVQHPLINSQIID